LWIWISITEKGKHVFINFYKEDAIGKKEVFFYSMFYTD